MNALTPKLKLGLDDLLADLWYARRSGDLGRLALVTYYEVRRWAKLAGDPTWWNTPRCCSWATFIPTGTASWPMPTGSSASWKRCAKK
ncbi:MAG: hypothetical protein IPG93_17000 [Burkholderiales bacterium]|nr:hypothetical protein [Burkholderiales bacterium]